MSSENHVLDRLRRLQVSDDSGARERTIAMAKAELQERGPRPALVRRRLAVALAIGLALVALEFTEPGRTVAREIGELIGIGDEPSAPELFDEGDVDSKRVVIGGGIEPGLGRYEVIASRIGVADEAAICLRVAFPDASVRHGSVQCLTQAAAERFDHDDLRSTADRIDASTVAVTGLTGSNVVSVEVRAGEDFSLDADQFELTAQLAAAIGSESSLSYFVALVPAAVASNHVHVAAYDGTGEAIDIQTPSVEKSPETVPRR